MTNIRDPGAMTENERFAEIASIFAVGYRRFALQREQVLAEQPRPEALLDDRLHGQVAAPVEVEP